MAQEIIMPKLGNTVESVIIVEWKKEIGDSITVGEALCEVETDKATVDVEAEVSGTLLARLFEADDDVPVLVPFAIVGNAGEDISGIVPVVPVVPSADTSPVSEKTVSVEAGNPAAADSSSESASGISPRARNLAASSGLDGLPASGSGPGGRIIERDVQVALEGRMPLTPAAMALGGTAPAAGSGIGGRITAADINDFVPGSTGSGPVSAATAVSGEGFPGPVESIPVKGIRQIIAQRMHASLLETAQLTLNSSADAGSMLAWRAGYKESPEEFGVSKISINDLLMFTVSRLLPKHPELNATFSAGAINRYQHVHLGFAVDTPKGLMVPVIRYADRLSLTELSAETRRLAAACREGKASPDDLSGGTFTVTNLGAFGIENFTPVLNAPEVAILGVGTIINRPIENADGSIGIGKRMGLSLTIDHQAVDGAPGARFLKDLSAMLARLEWVLAL